MDAPVIPAIVSLRRDAAADASRPGSTAALSRLNVDSRDLAALRREAREDPSKAAGPAARQFEQMFVKMLLKSMRDASPQSDPLSGESSRMFQGMLDEQWAQSVSSRGIGLASMIEKQLARAAKPAGAAPTPAGEPMKLRGPRESTLPEGATPGPGLAPRPPANAQQFIDRMLGPAREAAKITGLPPAFILGQAGLESGWGRREVPGATGEPSYNLFGIKAGASWTGRSVEASTTEYVNGAPQKLRERFRAYGSYEEAFADYARLLSANPRYAPALAERGDAAGFARAVARAGYATDPAYADKLTRTIRTAISATA